MNRLRQAGDSYYDVLGVSPNASDEEIHSAFRQLIDGEGYKVGVPLNRQWLRARQIKDAHSTLGDPAMRQAYDESLRQAPEPAPWAMTAEDPATDELIMPRPGVDEVVQSADGVATFNDSELVFAPTVRDGRRSWVKALGAATALASVLGVAILSSWSNRPPPAGDERSSAAAAEEQASGDGLGFARQVLGSFNRAAPTSFGATPKTPRASESAQNASDEKPAQDSGELLATGAADAQSRTNVTSTSASSSVAEVEARPVAPTPAPPAVPAPAIATAGGGIAASPERLVHIPPQWIGGGPTDADNVRGRYQGSLTVQVNVEADGSVSKCAPVRGSGRAGLDEMTCRLVRERARFAPALDAQGRPIEAQAYTTIVWGRNRRR